MTHPYPPYRTLYVLRHGQTDWNLQGRIQGHLDIPLNETGRNQARALSRHMKPLKIEAVLSSDLSRARETAQWMIADHAIPLIETEALREIYLGGAQGLSRPEIEERFGYEFSTRLRHHPLSDEDIVLLGSESGIQVYQRAMKAITEFFKTHDQKVIAVVTHGGVIRRLLEAAIQAFPPPTPNSCFYPFIWRESDGLLRLEHQLPLFR